MKVCGWEGYTQTDRVIWRSHVLEILLETKTRTRLTYKCWKIKINITFSDFLKHAKKVKEISVDIFWRIVNY